MPIRNEKPNQIFRNQFQSINKLLYAHFGINVIENIYGFHVNSYDLRQNTI